MKPRTKKGRKISRDTRRLDWLLGEGQLTHRLRVFENFYYGPENKARGMRQAIDAAIRQERVRGLR